MNHNSRHGVLTQGQLRTKPFRHHHALLSECTVRRGLRFTFLCGLAHTTQELSPDVVIARFASLPSLFELKADFKGHKKNGKQSFQHGNQTNTRLCVGEIRSVKLFLVTVAACWQGAVNWLCLKKGFSFVKKDATCLRNTVLVCKYSSCFCH